MEEEWFCFIQAAIFYIIVKLVVIKDYESAFDAVTLIQIP